MYQEKIDKTKQFTRGGQITFHNLRMLFQINKTVSSVYFLSLIALIILSIYLITPQDVLMSAWCWVLSQIYPLFEPFNIKLDPVAITVFGKTHYIAPKIFPKLPFFVRTAESIFYYIKVGVGIGFVLSLGVLYGLIKWLIRQGEKQTKDRFIRGSRLDTPKNVAKLIKKEGKSSDITIDGLPLIAGTETKHFLVHGTTGSGKTQLISKILDRLRMRGDRVFVYDKGGVFASCYYQENKDRILNPFDRRSENWNLWDEARSIPDFENMAESLIPMHGENDPFWVNAARTIFGSAAYTMQDKENRSVKELLKLLLTSELKELNEYLSGTDAATLASDKIEKTAISIRSVITTYLKSLRFLVDLEQTEKPKFCIRDWISNEDDRGWLFLTSNADQHAALKPLISMWFSMATIALLALPENYDRRIWFVCDELPSLHRLPQLPGVIAEARKFGGCFVLGMQSIAQLEQVYGKNSAKGIFDLLNTAFYFRSPSPDMAELVSRALGSQEVEDMRENYSYGANSIRDGISIGSQRVTSPIVFAPEIMTLNDLHCYLRFPGSYPITLLNLKLEPRRKIAHGFITSELESDTEIKNLIECYDTNDKKFKIKKLKSQKDDAETETKNKKDSDDVKESSDNIQEAKIEAEINKSELAAGEMHI
jgi:type IV conjugative transfer system coupling protein TraD